MTFSKVQLTQLLKLPTKEKLRGPRFKSSLADLLHFLSVM
jgi:hypothetical protein